MSSEIKPLEVLLGEKIIEIGTEVSTNIPIGNLGEEEMHFEIPLKVVFSKHVLFIYNKWSIISSNLRNIKDLKGISVAKISYENEVLAFVLKNLDTIMVDLSDSGWIGPESLVLYGPDNSIMVWN